MKLVQFLSSIFNTLCHIRFKIKYVKSLENRGNTAIWNSVDETKAASKMRCMNIMLESFDSEDSEMV